LTGSPWGHYPTEVRDAPGASRPLLRPKPTGRPGGPGRRLVAGRRGRGGAGERERRRQGWLEAQERRCTPRVGQRQGPRGTLARAHGAADALPRGPRHLAECLREWHVHLQAGLGHLEDVGGPRRTQGGPMAYAGAQGHEVCGGTTHRFPQPIAMPGLQSLTGAPGAFTPEAMRKRLGAAQTAGEATSFEHCTQETPGPPGGYQGAREAAAVDKPVRSGSQSGGVGANSPDTP
jgi:hypothetical protein